MKESLLRSFSRCTFNLLPILRSKLNPHSVPQILSTSSSSRFYSSDTPDPSESNLSQSQGKDGYISDEELRKLLKSVHEGDEETFNKAFPIVFRGVLSRMVEGKSAEEINKEFSILRGRDDEESDSDYEDYDSNYKESESDYKESDSD